MRGGNYVCSNSETEKQMSGAFAVERGVRMHDVRRGHVTSLILNGGCCASGGCVQGIGVGMVWVVGVWSGEVMTTGGGT